MYDLFIVVALLLALGGLHIFLCLRFFAHAGDVIKRVKVPRHAVGALMGFIGLALMALAMIVSWAAIAIWLYGWLGSGNFDGILYVLGALALAPIIHLIAEMLVNVSYNEA